MLHRISLKMEIRIPGIETAMDLSLDYDLIRIIKDEDSDFKLDLSSTLHGSTVHLEIPAIAWTVPYIESDEPWRIGVLQEPERDD